MQLSNDLSLYRAKNRLVIQIQAVPLDEEATATIISHAGETIDKFTLKQGANYIDIVKFSSKKYSIRVKNGNNVIVQRI